MQVALYARVSTSNQHQEGTISSQIQSLHLYVRQQGWSLLPAHEYIDEGVSGTRLDRPALDRLRDCAQRGEFDAVVVLSPDRLARNYAHQWLLIEEFEKLHVQWVFLQNPFGDTPQGKLLTQMQGMMAEYERAQIHERTRRGRLEKARRGEFMPWAFSCYGYRYLPKRHGCAPQVTINLEEAEVVRQLYRSLVEEQVSCRQLTKRLNDSQTPTPSGKRSVWHCATVRNILINRVYTGQARYNYRQPVLPKYRKTEKAQLASLKTGRSYRPPQEWVWSEAPAIIPVDLFEKAQLQLQRNAEVARKMYQPASRRYLLRTLVKCGECGLGMIAAHQRSVCKKYEYLYYECKGHSPLTCGRSTKCASRRVRADRLDTVVWNSLCELLRTPALLPQLHQHWAQSKQHDLTALTAQQEQLLQRKRRVERQSDRLLEAYQTEIITLSELQLRRQKLTTELHQLDRELQQLTQSHQQTLHWHDVIAHVDHFRQLLGENLDRLPFADRQTVAQCLIKKVVVTGEHVDISYLLPFDQAPQVYKSKDQHPEGTPGHFYRLRLADLDLDHLSQGRFVLGLGTGPEHFTKGYYGMPYDKPVSRLREVVQIVRHVEEGARTGKMTDWNGTCYQLESHGYEPTAPPQRERIPVWIAALRERMCELAGEVGDGLIGHPVWSIEWSLGQAQQSLAVGAARTGRDPSTIHFQPWVMAAIDRDPKVALSYAKPSVAFYAGIALYHSYFAAHGFAAEARKCQAASHSMSAADAASLIPDEMARTFVACGTPDQVRERIEPLWQRANSMMIGPPSWGLTPEQYAANTAAIAETFWKA